MKKLIFLPFIFSALILNAQQWGGSSTTSGVISRDGIVLIGGSSVVGSWGSGTGILELQAPLGPGNMCFLALRQQGSNATSMDIGFKANEYGAIYTNQVPMYFSTNGQTRMTITPSGNIGIGTTTPGSFKLAVEGKIGAREIKVTLDNPWPDYVFNQKYPLMDIADLDKYISINKHLPGIPSAKEIKDANGIELGQMTSKLMEKVEELTLYLIQLKKENDEIKVKLKELSDK